MAYRGEIADLGAKNDGNENPGWTSKKLKVDHEIDDPHSGAVECVVQYDGSEFSVRIFAANRDWHLRNLSYRALLDEAHRLFPRLHLSFKRTRSAELATNPAAILRG